jgi:hypothetical protein
MGECYIPMLRSLSRSDWRASNSRRKWPPTWSSWAGKVLTVDGENRVHEAVAVKNGRILIAGSSEEVKRLVGPSTRVVDSEGQAGPPRVHRQP